MHTVFAKDGVECILRKFCENSRKKTFPFFSFLLILKNGKSFLLEIGSPPDFRFTVARTSQSPFPCPIIENIFELKTTNNE